MKTSKLICMILQNEGEVEFNATIGMYIQFLINKGYISTNGTKIKLTNKGQAYIR